jgi:hypothetical protein
MGGWGRTTMTDVAVHRADDLREAGVGALGEQADPAMVIPEVE